MALLHKKHARTCSTGCLVVKWLLCILLLIVAVAALVGVYNTHILFAADPVEFRMQFGSTSGSLAILAFAIASTAFMKHMISCLGECEICS